MNMDTTSQPGSAATASDDASKKRPTAWIVLAFWFIWLAALMVMSFPYWGKSKRDLIETKDEPVRRIDIKK